jgi:hypothetical protein
MIIFQVCGEFLIDFLNCSIKNTYPKLIKKSQLSCQIVNTKTTSSFLIIIYCVFFIIRRSPFSKFEGVILKKFKKLVFQSFEDFFQNFEDSYVKLLVICFLNFEESILKH